MPKFIIKSFSENQEYQPIWHKMRDLVNNFNSECAGEIWLLEHNPIYTLGQAADEKHVLNSEKIQVIRSDRGGQITYHGPGQLMVYTIFNLKKLGIGIKSLVCKLEQAVIDMLQEHKITACRHAGRPGVYVAEKKICSIGLRVRKGISYHGIAININTDKAAFANINPCGYKGLEVCNINDYIEGINISSIKTAIVAQLEQQFNLVENT
jgi:lipoyl(octanoyl) transferase